MSAAQLSRTVADLRQPRRGWEAAAACIDSDPNWLPTRGCNGPVEVHRKACRRCPVRQDCLLAALHAGDRTRMAGGYTPWERDALLERIGVAPITEVPAADADRRDVEDAIVRLRREGCSTAEIARRAGVGERLVRRVAPGPKSTPSRIQLPWSGPVCAGRDCWVPVAEAGQVCAHHAPDPTRPARERNGRTFIHPGDIRRLSADGWSAKQLAELYECSESRIARMRRVAQ